MAMCPLLQAGVGQEVPLNIPHQEVPLNIPHQEVPLNIPHTQGVGESMEVPSIDSAMMVSA